MKILRNRHVWWPLAGAYFFLALAAVVLVVVPNCWPLSIVFFYSAFQLARCVHYEYSRQRWDALASRWWLDQKRGIRRPPLDPCCMPRKLTGREHDDLNCTRDRTGEPDLKRERIEFARLLFGDSGDREQEEDA